MPVLGISGESGTLPRALGDYLCYYPFLDPAKVLASASVEERYRQCQLFGGVGVGHPPNACQIDRTRALCPAGWLHYDNYCYFKPSTYQCVAPRALADAAAGTPTSSRSRSTPSRRA